MLYCFNGFDWLFTRLNTNKYFVEAVIPFAFVFLDGEFSRL